MRNRFTAAQKLSFLQHHFRRFNDGANDVADLQLHFFRAAGGDDALDQVIADFHHDVGHHVSELNLNNFADKAVTR